MHVCTRTQRLGVQGALCILRCLEWAVVGGGEKGQKVHLSEWLWLLIIVIISYYSCPWSPLFKRAYKGKKEAKQADHWLLPLSPTVFKPLQAQKEGMWCWDVSLCKRAMSSMDEDGIYLRRWLNEHPSVSQKKMMQDHKYEHKAGMPGLEIACHSHLSFTPFGGKGGMVATVVCLFVCLFLLLTFSPNYPSVTWPDLPGQLWWGEEQLWTQQAAGQGKGEWREEWLGGTHAPIPPWEH